MTEQEYINEIKLKLTGDILETELSDDTYHKILQSALREIQRYINSTYIITVPYKPCIDLSNKADTNDIEIKVNSITSVLRTEDLTGGRGNVDVVKDPMQVAQWQLLSGMGNMYYFQHAIDNLGAWSTMQQIRNTTSTDLQYIYDEHTNKLYINVVQGTPQKITIEYVPRYSNVEEITSDFWIDMLMRLSVALTKVTLGRIRTRYTQSNALWTQDGDTILAEGNEELSNIRQMLVDNTMLMYPVD